MRLAMVAAMVMALVPGCSGADDKEDTTVSNTGNKTGGTTDTTDTTDTTESGQALLDQLIRAANDTFYATEGDEARQAVLDDLSAKVAAAASVTDELLDAEIERRNGHVVSLHSGETRVYPDPTTMSWMLGVVSALEKARELRR